MRTEGLNNTVANLWLGFLVLAASLDVGCRSTPAPESHSSAAEASADRLGVPPLVAGTTTRAHFAVQVSALRGQTQANELALQLANRYKKEVLITPTTAQDQKLYRVRVLVVTRAEAEELALVFRREQQLETWIVPFP